MHGTAKNPMPGYSGAEFRELRWRAQLDAARIEKLQAALRDISRFRIMDGLTAIKMRAIANGVLWPEDTRH